MVNNKTNSDGTALARDTAFKDIVDGHPESILIFAEDGVPLYANASASGLLSRLADEGQTLPDALAHASDDTARLTLSDVIGGEVVLTVRADAITWEGRAARLLYVTDETHQTRQHESLARLAYTDHLTGLYNRRGLELVGEHHCLVAARAGEHVVAFFIDLDGLKQINDRYGHHTGDEALVELADVIGAVFRDSDIKARVGGDEIVVLITEDAPGRVDHLLARISTEVERRNAASGRQHNLSISIGVARHGPEAGLNIDALLAEADRCMYDAKRQAQPGAARPGETDAQGPVVGVEAAAPQSFNLALMYLAL